MALIHPLAVGPVTFEDSAVRDSRVVYAGHDRITQAAMVSMS